MLLVEARMRAIEKRNMLQPSPPEAARTAVKIDFELIEKAGKVKFDKLQRNKITFAVRMAKRMQRAVRDIPAERLLSKELAGACRRCAELLRAAERKDTFKSHRIEDSRVYLDVTDLEFECCSESSRDRLFEWLKRTVGSVPEKFVTLTLDQVLDVIAIVRKERSIRLPGRPLDKALRWLILCAQLRYEEAGGKGKAYWNAYSGHYRGPFLDLMEALLDQAGITHKRNSLAQAIIDVVQLRKATMVEEPDVADNRKSRSMSAVKKARLKKG
jgi:hypothetical protein